MIRWKGGTEDAWPDEEEEEKVDDVSEVWIDRYAFWWCLQILYDLDSTFVCDHYSDMIYYIYYLLCLPLGLHEKHHHHSR